MSGFVLRDYQLRLVNDIRSKIADGKRRILCVLPTGGGKGVVAASIMESTASKGNRGVFFADQRELIDQLRKHLVGQEIPVDVLMSGVENEYMDSDDFGRADFCRLIAKDTLWSRRESIDVPDASVVQVDEAHKSLADTWVAVMEMFSDAVVIGWTATPCRTDGRPLGEFYDSMVYGASYKELQAAGHLVPVKVYAPDHPDLKGISSYRGDYAKGQLCKRMNKKQMVGSIVKEWKLNSEDRGTIVFAAGVDHSLHLRDEFNRAGISAEHLDGTLPPAMREDIIGRARDEETTVICNYGVATTGVDVPAWKYLVMARPTKSFALFRQMGGRIQRPFRGHDHCFIQDHSDNTIHFGYPDEDVEWDLNGSGTIQEKVERDRVERESHPESERLCKECAAVFVGPACPRCGYRWERPAKELKMKKAELKELERRKANREATPMDKQKYWDKCLGIAINRNQKVGAAAWLYKENFGVWPNKSVQNVPRSSQWQMKAMDFYMDVVKPANEIAKREAKL